MNCGGADFIYQLNVLVLWTYSFIQPSQLGCNKIGPAVEECP